ncbi:MULTISPECIES: polyamine ABC transporter substrate-binding protein [unclassified Beijerinckia]|uniref:polyamine ABC transporter substrate-binding protein n=1 Tax=unclassified Beijerinckia TaxID=2638183 RepID=UPI000AD1D179|nr:MULTISPECIES: polyamine ABC transporter substrate-binding protein [unclassified Beijerinckia]
MRKLLTSFVALLALATPALAQTKVVNVFNWSDYVDQKLLDAFTKETGIKVVYDTYDSNETLETRLLAGKSGYDVVVPSGTFLQRQIKAGIYQKLDRSKLPNSSEIWPEIATRLSAYDPGNEYSVNYMWFTTGIAFNVEKIKARLGDRPIDSWDMIFKPENIKKVADCGVYMLDSPEDILSIALRYLGLNPETRNQNEIKRAADLVMQVKPYIRKFHSSEYINALANGDICMAVAWAGDSFQARNRAREAGNGVVIDYVIPKEGTLMSMDNLAIPKDAEHVDEAYAFINFLLRPDVAARNSTVTNFASGILKAKALLAPEIADNKSIYPDEATMRRLFTVAPYEQTLQRFVTREWTRIKTSR